MPAPDINSNYYKMYSYGGWNPCVEGNNDYGLLPYPGCVIPNCSGFATGRYNERLNLGACTYLGSANGGDFMRFAYSQNLGIRQTPVVGGAMVWRNSGEGHVAIVEQIVSSTQIVCSESGWYWTTAPAWDYRTHYYNNGSWHSNPDYRYLGCICPPGVPGDGSDIIPAVITILWRDDDDELRYPR